MSNPEPLSIGEVARRAGRRPSSIRYYEQIGLLPAATRVAGRRVYSPDALRTLAVIETAQRAGLTLEEIKALLSASPDDMAAIERLREVAERKLPEVAALIERSLLVRDWLECAARCECPSLDQCPLFDDPALRTIAGRTAGSEPSRAPPRLFGRDLGAGTGACPGTEMSAEAEGALTLLKGSTVKPGHHAKIVTTMIGLGLAAAACSSTSTSTTSSTRSAAPATTPAFLGELHGMTQVASTVPANGDVNPYGVAVVPASAGRLTAGDILVSNFNDKANVQGTGNTVVQVSPAGKASVFASIAALPAGQTCPGGIGLTTALGILPGGWVVVGSLPTSRGGVLPGLDPAGCLIVLNDRGTVAETITNRDLVGPWDLTVTSNATSAEVFVSNALGGNTSTHDGVPVTGNCTVVRLDLRLSPSSPPTLTSSTVIGTGFPWRANKAALILAPTGLALSSNGTLYVDDTQTNSVSAIPQALTRTSAITAVAGTLSVGGALSAPLGMTIAPNGDLVVVNGNNGNAVEITPAGKQILTRTLIKNGAGDLFGIITTPRGLLIANDGTNALDEANM
jgi:DNA-binding transcriptional MerR regulator